jgi:hypothetical protein
LLRAELIGGDGMRLCFREFVLRFESNPELEVRLLNRRPRESLARAHDKGGEVYESILAAVQQRFFSAPELLQLLNTWCTTDVHCPVDRNLQFVRPISVLLYHAHRVLPTLLLTIYEQRFFPLPRVDVADFGGREVPIVAS